MMEKFNVKIGAKFCEASQFRWVDDDGLSQ